MGVGQVLLGQGPEETELADSRWRLDSWHQGECRVTTAQPGHVLVAGTSWVENGAENVMEEPGEISIMSVLTSIYSHPATNFQTVIID